MSLSLIQRFSLMCLVALLLVGYALAYTLSNSMGRMMHMGAVNETSVIVRQNFLKHFSPSDFAQPKQGDEYDMFKYAISHLSFGPNIIDVKVWNRDGQIIWCDDRDSVGRTVESEGLRRALAGKVVSLIDHDKEGEQGHYESDEAVNIQEIYVPVLFPGQSEPNIIVEIYKDVTPLVSEIKIHESIIWTRLSMGFLALYGLLFGIVYSASRRISAQTEELEDMFLQTTTALVNALDTKSPWTKGHSERTEKYAEHIARAMGFDDHAIREIMIAGLLHDIGKIGTYGYLLEKVEPLTKDEINVIRQHPDHGIKILGGIRQLKNVLPIIRHHHEHYDGKGYPSGLKAEQIPLGARILYVADSYDAMTYDRPYRRALGKEGAINELKANSGTQFDPQVVEVFLKIIEDGKNS